jgi:hypothetical protein
MFRIHWESGRSKLVLPVVGAPKNPTKLFASEG